jgi:hypothetical protein
MSKYKELAKKANVEENIDLQIENNEPILKAEIEAMVQSQKATVIRAKNTYDQAEKAVDKARGYITDKGSVYISKVNAAKDARDQAAEALKIAEENLEDLEEELKLF